MAARVGAVYRIQIEGQADVLAAYHQMDPHDGPLVSFYHADTCPFELGLNSKGLIFGPVLVGINPPVRQKRWLRDAAYTAIPVKRPYYLTWFGSKDLKPIVWFLNIKGRDFRMRWGVPRRLQDLETLIVWSFYLIEERIVTGRNPYSYASIMSW